MKGLLEYIKETKKLGETYSEIKNDVAYDNFHLFVKRDRNVWPGLPNELRMKLISKAASMKDYEGKLARIVDVLEKEKDIVTKCFELEEWNRINNYDCPEDTTEDDKNKVHRMSVAAFQLRKLRKQIYDSANLNDKVKKDLKRYRFQVGCFVKEFKENLTSREIRIWRKKVKTTESDIRNSERTCCFS